MERLKICRLFYNHLLINTIDDEMHTKFCTNGYHLHIRIRASMATAALEGVRYTKTRKNVQHS